MKMTFLFLAFFIAGLGVVLAPLVYLVGNGVLVIGPASHGRLAGGIVLALAILGGVAVLLIGVLRRFNEPLGQILQSIEDISEGNLSPSLPESAPAELGTINDALRIMCVRLSGMRVQLDDLSRRVMDATSGAGRTVGAVQDGIQAQSGAASRTFDAVGHLSEGLMAASRDIETMSGRVQDSAAQVAEMDRAIGQVAESISGLKAIIEEASEFTRRGDENTRILARDVADVSAQVSTANLVLSNMANGAERALADGNDAARIMDSLREETERIGAAIEATIEGSDAIHLSNERILEVTASLQSRVDRVDDVLEAVHSLAERTKLLSINASIIASEAGEHGRAFAVVAREVKELAQSTATAISEISVVLVGLKEGFGQTVRTIQRGQEDVDTGIRMARNAVVLLRSIPDKVHQAAELTNAIAKQNASQKNEGAEVKRIVEKVSSTMRLVGDLLSEQVARNNHTLQLFNSISLTAEQVLGSASDHAIASNEVNHAVEVLSGDFKGVAEQVRSNVSGLNTIVQLAEEVLTITDDNRLRAAEVNLVIGDLGRFAERLGERREHLLS